MAVQVDLQQLAHSPESAPRQHVHHRGRFVWLTRYVLPMTLLLGFAGVLAYSFRDWLLPAERVTVVPVMALRGAVAEASAPLFQSAGWVEARPTPVLVSALEEGVIEELLVIEGQELRKGDVVARLIDADARLDLRNAEAELTSRQAEVVISQAAVTAAEARMREPIELETRLAEAEALLARVENEVSRLPSQLKSAKARAELATREKESRLQASEVVSKLALARAENEFEMAAAGVTELQVQLSALEKEHAAQQRRVNGLRRQLELKIEEKRQQEEAVAGLDQAVARLAQAQVALDRAKLRLSRMTIHAPVDGKVLTLVARPGTKVSGLRPESMPDASTVVTMYDPLRLQVRADVRLEEVPRVFTGQRVRIETPAVDGALAGVVIAATSLTDIQKNTLQVKVAIEDPPAVLKPDMLVQVTFLSPAQTTDSSAPDAPVTLAVPTNLIIQTNGQPAYVWVADRQNNVARMRTVTLGGATSSGLREVRSGLDIGDRLIASGMESLSDGERIHVVGEVPAEMDHRDAESGGSARESMKRL